MEIQLKEPTTWKHEKYTIELYEKTKDLVIFYDKLDEDIARAIIHINADTNLKMTIKTPHNKSTIIIPNTNKKTSWIFNKETLNNTIKQTGIKTTIKHILNEIFNEATQYKHNIIKDLNITN
jgi:ribosomal protein S20